MFELPYHKRVIGEDKNAPERQEGVLVSFVAGCVQEGMRLLKNPVAGKFIKDKSDD